jgi:hypothetical protein
MTDRRVLGATFLVAFLVVFGVHALDFYGSVPNFVKASRGGVLLDIKPAFAEADLYARLERYGEEGRKIYSFRNVSVDAVLPLSLLPFLFLFMREALKVLHLGRLPATVLLSVPIAYVVFDFAENAAVLGLLARFPDRVHFLAAVLPYLTVVKRTASIMALLIPFVVLTFAFVRRRLRRVA